MLRLELTYKAELFLGAGGDKSECTMDVQVPTAKPLTDTNIWERDIRSGKEQDANIRFDNVIEPQTQQIIIK